MAIKWTAPEAIESGVRVSCTHAYNHVHIHIYRGPVTQNLFLSKSLPLAVDTSSVQTILVEALGSGVGLHGFVLIGAQGGNRF